MTILTHPYFIVVLVSVIIVGMAIALKQSARIIACINRRVAKEEQKEKPL